MKPFRDCGVHFQQITFEKLSFFFFFLQIKNKETQEKNKITKNKE